MSKIGKQSSFYIPPEFKSLGHLEDDGLEFNVKIYVSLSIRQHKIQIVNSQPKVRTPDHIDASIFVISFSALFDS